MKHRSSRLKAALGLVVSAVLAVTMTDQPAWAGKPDPYVPPKPAQQPAVKVGKVAAAAARTDRSPQAANRPAPVWPTAGSLDVTLAQSGSPVGFRRSTAKAAAAAPAKMRVDVLDQAASARAGVRGVVFKARRADGVAGAAPVKVTVDYSKFANAYGADWSHRLRLVRLPDCALTTPNRTECAATAVPTRNDTEAQKASAEVELTGAGQVMALAAAPSGKSGNYGATSLKASGTWSAGGSSGNFSWSFPMRMPPAMGGPEPTVSLAYSSQSVDGQMVSSNNQPSEVGEGFELGGIGYIERRFKPCSDDTTNGNNAGAGDKDADDQCWATDNATLSLNGSGGELIKDATIENLWHLRNDDGSRVERRTGADNGAQDGEWWVVTTPNGTQYWFGRNKLPGWTTGDTTNSAWTVPVFGNHAKEPCNGSTFAASMCKRAWRWNLDYVVDPHNNTASYWYNTETNNYQSVATKKVQSYIRGGTLDHVAYGTRVEPNLATGKDSVFTGKVPARVKFEYAERCLSDCGTKDGKHWPDTPWDLDCPSTTSCDVRVPSFWSTRRLATVTTSVYEAMTGKLRDVERWTLTHSFPDPEDGTRAGLWLAKVGHVGLVGDTTVLPDVTLLGKNMPNRVDTVDESPPMNWRRLTDINTETGAIVHVDYLDSDCVAGTAVPTKPETNTMRCYPVRWTPPGFPEKTDYFNRYVVNEVTETDRTGGSPRVLNHYTYLTTPAWHYADDDGLIPDDAKTWNVWRGYQKVGVTTGDPGEQTYTETTYFRGMDGDYLSKTSTRSASVPDSQGGSVPDDDAYTGMVRETRTLLKRDGAEVSGEINDPWKSAATASRTIGDVTVHARFVETEGTHSRVTLDHAPWVRTTYTKSTFDKYGMVVKEDDFGDEAVTGDEQCTSTTYEPRNTDGWLLNLPHRVQTYSVTCARAAEGGLTEDDVIGDARNYYDLHGYGVAPSIGDATKTEQMDAWNSGSPTYKQLSRTRYDELGRTVESWDANDRSSTTAFTPATSGPVTQTVDMNWKGWKSTTVMEPAWGLATATVDLNDLRTELAYDGLGRLTKVWKPGRPRTDTPDIAYDYLIRTDGVNTVTTSHLNPKGGVTKAYALYDGLLRARQTQTVSPAGGRILSDTFYDTAGRASLSYGSYWDKTGPPGPDLVKPLIKEDVPNQTATVYDAAGRVTDQIFQPNGKERWRTSTYYGGDHTDVTPPKGGTGTSTWIDARERTVRLRQYPTRAPTGTDYDETSYEYNRKGLLSAVVGPDSSKWTYAYDLRGRKIGSTDPDAGSSTIEYDAFDRISHVQDGTQQWLTTTYDDLDRKVGLWKGKTPTSAGQLAQWDYDQAQFPDGKVVKGQLYQSTRLDASKGYYVITPTYDTSYRPTRTTVKIPTSETGIGGTYDIDTGYNVDGSVSAMTYPATADLQRETVRYKYTDYDQPSQLLTSYGTAAESSLVSDSQYDALGHATQYSLYTGLFSGVGNKSYISLETDATTGRLSQISVHRDGKTPNTVTDQHFEYDDLGNVTKIADKPTGGGYTDIQCFTYDRRQRLQEAWTPAADDCAPAPTNQTLGGPAPYWQSYSYTKGGARQQMVDHATPKGDVTTGYTFADTAPADPAAGQPHALRSVKTTDSSGTKTVSYTYDKAGNAKTRPGPNGTQTLVWDAEGHLQSVTDTTGSTSYLYDADGNRLLSRDATGRTLYLPNQEIRYTNSTGVSACTRYYSFGGGTVGQRTSKGLTWLSNDHQGTQNVMIDEKTLGETIRRQAPFGTPRGPAVTWNNTKGFVGGTNDPTGLTHLGAREYDPALGRFISVDPVFDGSNPQSFEGYAYAGNNPIVNSDPSGLMFASIADSGGAATAETEKTYRDIQDDKAKSRNSSKKKSKCGFSCKFKKGVNWVDDHKAVIAGVVVGAAVGVGCGAAIGWTGVGLVACGALGGAIGGMVEYSISTGVEHNGNFSIGGMLKQGLIGGLIGGVSSVGGSLAGQGIKAGFKAVASKFAARSAAKAGKAAVSKEASSVAGGLSKQGFNKSAPKASEGAEPLGCNSFAASTLVLMADGSVKPISAVKVGDKVVATDPATGRSSRREVTKLHVNRDTALADVTVTVAGGRKAVIRTTQQHRFWNVTKQRWAEASEMVPGDGLRSAGRAKPYVAEVATYVGVNTMYDLTVDTVHTYYVLAGTTPVLVHNCGPSIQDMYESATKGRGSSAAARSYAKHMNRPDTSLFPVSSGRDRADLSEHLVADLLTNPKAARQSYTTDEGVDVIDIWLPDIGARWTRDGKFVGFRKVPDMRKGRP